MKNVKKSLLLLFLVMAFISCDNIAGRQKLKLVDVELPFIEPQPEYTEAQIAKLKEAANTKPQEIHYKWQELEITAFIHFGVNTFTGKEWGTGEEDPKLFNPTDLDCEQWLRAVKKGGANLAILTAKHHDGFCLWPSKYTEHSVKNSDWKDGKGDVMQEFVDACKVVGIKPGFYLSPWDMNSPDFGKDRGGDYNEYYNNQVIEILDNYGPFYEVWFDGANESEYEQDFTLWNPGGAHEIIKEFETRWENGEIWTDSEKYYGDDKYIVLACNGPDGRWVGNENGLARDSEWSVLPKKGWDMEGDILYEREELFKADSFQWYPAECDVSIRPGWFYHAYQDLQVKSVEHLLNIYYQSVGRNSVLLLNFPPNKKGIIHKNDIKNASKMYETIKKSLADNLAQDIEPVITKAEPEDYYYKTVYEYDLKDEVQFNRVLITEDIQNSGQRVENFHIEYFYEGKWRNLSYGGTIGYKRILCTDLVPATKLRLVIDRARGEVDIAKFEIYKSAYEDIAKIW